MNYKVNNDASVAVATDYYWLPMDTCPLGVKVQLLNAGDVAIYGQYNGKNKEWRGWAPLPKKPPVVECK